MIVRRAPGWQLILADLSLILFLVTLSTLAGAEMRGDAEGNAAPPATADDFSEVAAAQALFRPDPLGPTLGEWLSEQSPDPRAMLTIFAKHGDEDREAVWEIAQALADDANGRGFAVRVVVMRRGADSASEAGDIYASLAYDDLSGD